MSAGILTRRQRAAARLLTGTLSHLICGLLDWLQLAARLLGRRLR